MPSLPSVQAIEDRSGLPVLSSSVATTYAMLKRLSLSTRVPGFGALLSGRFD
ncbi:Maleate isomerase [compost metagenome]